MNAKYSVNIQIRIKKVHFTGLFDKILLNLQEYIFISTRDCLLGKAGNILSRRVLFVLPTQRSFSRKKLVEMDLTNENIAMFAMNERKCGIFCFKMCFQSFGSLNFDTFPLPQNRNTLE